MAHDHPRGSYGGGYGGYYPSSSSFPDTPIYDSLVAERGTPQIAPIRVPSAYTPYESGSYNNSYGGGSNLRRCPPRCPRCRPVRPRPRSIRRHSRRCRTRCSTPCRVPRRARCRARRRTDTSRAATRSSSSRPRTSRSRRRPRGPVTTAMATAGVTRGAAAGPAARADRVRGRPPGAAASDPVAADARRTSGGAVPPPQPRSGRSPAAAGRGLLPGLILPRAPSARTTAAPSPVPPPLVITHPVRPSAVRVPHAYPVVRSRCRAVAVRARWSSNRGGSRATAAERRWTAHEKALERREDARIATLSAEPVGGDGVRPRAPGR